MWFGQWGGGELSLGKDGAWSPPGDGRGASGGWQSWREVGDEEEEPDEVSSEPSDVEGDFTARWSSMYTKKETKSFINTYTITYISSQISNTAPYNNCLTKLQITNKCESHFFLHSQS